MIPHFLPERRELETLSTKENAPDTFFRQLLGRFPPREIKKDKKKKG